MHNHPSGDPTPPSADVQITKQIVDIAKPLGIAIHEHIIVGNNGHATPSAITRLRSTTRPAAPRSTIICGSRRRPAIRRPPRSEQMAVEGIEENEDRLHGISFVGRGLFHGALGETRHYVALADDEQHECGPIRDWPRYGRVDELPAECEELRANYYAVVAEMYLRQKLPFSGREVEH